MSIVQDFTDVLDDNNWNYLARWDKYARGEFERAGLPSTNRTALAFEYDDLLSRADLPICSLVVSAVVDRLRVGGFRASMAHEFDEQLWEWFQYSYMDARQTMVYRDAMVFGDGYVSVTPGGEFPIFRAESPLQMSTRFDDYDPTKVRVAAKVAGRRGWLYTEDYIHRFERKDDRARGWEEVGRIEHAAGEVPIVRFGNRLDSRGWSQSEVGLVAPIQRRIIQTVADRLLVQRAAAWKQRWVAGISVDTDDNGKAIPPFEVGVDQLVVSEDPNTKFGEWNASSFREHLEAVEADIRAAAAITQTPPHLLSPMSISNISADALIALEAGLTAKVQERQQNWGESWEYALRIGGRMVGMDVPETAETVWVDLERRSDAQRIDGATKLRSIGLPMGYLLERLGLSPQTIERVLDEQRAEQQRNMEASAAAFGLTPGAGPMDDQQQPDA